MKLTQVLCVSVENDYLGKKTNYFQNLIGANTDVVPPFFHISFGKDEDSPFAPGKRYSIVITED